MKENLEVNKVTRKQKKLDFSKKIFKEMLKIRKDLKTLKNGQKNQQPTISDSVTQISEIPTNPDNQQIHRTAKKQDLKQNQEDYLYLQQKVQDLNLDYAVCKFIKNFKTQSQTIISQLLETSFNLKVKNQENEINRKRFELGELQIRREGTKLTEVWVDGEKFKSTRKEKDLIQQELAQTCDSNFQAILAQRSNYLDQQLKCYESQKIEYMLEMKDYQNSIKLIKEPLDLCERYKVVEILGNTGLHSIYKAFDFDNLSYIEQLMDKQSNIFIQQKTLFIQMALQECDILKSLNHENFPKYLDQIEIDPNCFGLVMELCEGMTLENYIEIYKNDYQENDYSLRYQREENCILILKHICEAIHYIHQKNLYHLDLKPSNIMFDNQLIKIIDFGISNYKDNIELTPLRGTFEYQAPECHNTSLKERQGDKIDVWAIGIIFFELYHGHKKIMFDDNQKVIIDENLSMKSRLILWKSLEKDYNKRCTTQDLIKIIQNQDNFFDNQGNLV